MAASGMTQASLSTAARSHLVPVGLTTASLWPTPVYTVRGHTWPLQVVFLPHARSCDPAHNRALSAPESANHARFAVKPRAVRPTG